jgi:RNA polymerase sigma-70 factor (ECF subfamily)
VSETGGGVAGAALERAFREERAAVLATLIRYVGDFQLAEDAVQDAFVDAAAKWHAAGVPANPGAWLTVDARRRAINRIRRGRALSDRAARLAELIALETEHESVELSEAPTIEDDRLRLIFTCCHPALDVPSRVALTLRTLGGLTTGEIARAFLVADPTMGKRIVRAKRKIADANIPYRVPADEDLPERMGGVLRVLYLIFNEGYTATEGDELVRGELCGEAIRLGRLLSRLMPDEGEVWGLLALMLLSDSRRATRTSMGDYVALTNQDRARWNREKTEQGLDALRKSVRLRRPGPYQLQAAIAAVHTPATDANETDWEQIADLYGALQQLTPSPVIEINRAVAVGFANGPHHGLQLLAPLLDDPRVAAYQPLHAARAELFRAAGDTERAAGAYEQAIALSTNEVERAELQRRLGALRAN